MHTLGEEQGQCRIPAWMQPIMHQGNWRNESLELWERQMWCIHISTHTHSYICAYTQIQTYVKASLVTNLSPIASSCQFVTYCRNSCTPRWKEKWWCQWRGPEWLTTVQLRRVLGISKSRRYSCQIVGAQPFEGPIAHKVVWSSHFSIDPLLLSSRPPLHRCPIYNPEIENLHN